MDGREGMASYYLNRGGGVGGSNSGSGVGVGVVGGGGGGGSMTPTGVPAPPGYKTLTNPNISVQSNVGGGGAPMGSAFQVENPSPSYAHGITMSMASTVTPVETVKKKRGRPRKYGPDGAGANMALGLSPLSSTPSPGSITPGGSKKSRGRPPGSGWKQRLAPLGDWMNSTAGLAFTPHVIHVGVGEDIAAKILSFAQQRPRALCILSANGSVSAVTLRQPTTSGGTVTYEGRFEILCLSGSYLLAESGGPRNRTGGLSISVCSPDGHVIGGAIGGRLIASSPAQVVVCSFVYGGTKGKSKSEASDKDDKSIVPKSEDKSSALGSGAPGQDPTGNSGAGGWPPVSRPDLRNPQTEIDLTRG
ncbi:AT-hook motif nuclear-localized protein 5-like [Coffea arabica]|uniref:AT-hook motif nuclear-localized protein n=1 Tax=Coffea arabica TaxID=13443 RepID=A0A6P6U3J8_COFAR|nr:AT-hook motif nuclear-localized protein 5-like [Coffea arabica]